METAIGTAERLQLLQIGRKKEIGTETIQGDEFKLTNMWSTKDTPVKMEEKIQGKPTEKDQSKES